MRRLAIIAALALATMHGAHADVCDVDIDVQADRDAFNRQTAQCWLDTNDRFGRMQTPHGMTSDEAYTWTAKTNIRLHDLCMEAAGWPATLAYTPTTHEEHTLARWRREGICQEKIPALEKQIVRVHEWVRYADEHKL